MTPLRAFLIFRQSDGVCNSLVFRDLESIHSAWDAREDSDRISALLHVGFWRPNSNQCDGVLSNFPGKLLYTQSTIKALPAEYKFSSGPVGEADSLLVFLALNKWGYETESSFHESATKSFFECNSVDTGLVDTSQFPDWFHDLALVSPGLANQAISLGIRNETSYLLKESSLPPTLRIELGQARFSLLTRGFEPDVASIIDYLQFAPPWLLKTPIAQLDLTVRSDNALRAQGIAEIGDLKSYKSADVLKFPNLGRKSLQEIEHLILGKLHVTTFLEGKQSTKDEKKAESDGPPSQIKNNAEVPNEIIECNNFEDAYRYSLDLFPDRYKSIFQARAGALGPDSSLQDVGEKFAVTRERVRQIETKILRTLKSQFVWSLSFPRRLGNLLYGRSDPLPLTGLDILDPWFRGASSRPLVFKYLADRVSDPSFYVIDIDGQTYVTRIKQQEWLDVLSSAKKLLESMCGKGIGKDEARRLVEALMPDVGQELRSDLWFSASRKAQFSKDGPSYILVGFGSSAEVLVETVLHSSDRPIHFSEIHRRLEADGENLEIRRVYAAAGVVGLLFGRGTYGLRKHLPLLESEESQLIAEIEALIDGSEAGRQWHAREIHEEIEVLGLDFDGRVDPYIVNIVLKASTRLNYLGRMIWISAATGVKGASNRLDVHQAIVALLQSAGSPLETDDIRDRLVRERGLSSHFQVHPEGPVLKVGVSKWGLMGRDVPFSPQKIAEFIDTLKEVLEELGKGIHISEIKPFLEQRLSYIRSVEDPNLLFGIAQKFEEFSIGKGQYLFLDKWGDPRRPTISLAVYEVLSKAGRRGLSAAEGFPKIESLIGRRLPKSNYGQLCNSIGAQFDEVNARWYLEDSSSEEVDDPIP
jgi:hypothetical protein